MRGRNEVLTQVADRCARAAARVHVEMNRGLTTLASIATAAPLLGFVGTALLVLRTFGPGISDDRRNIARFMARNLSQSLVPTALALIISVLAFAAHRYFSDRLEILDTEMKNASSELLDELSRFA